MQKGACKEFFAGFLEPFAIHILGTNRDCAGRETFSRKSGTLRQPSFEVIFPRYG